MDCMSWMIHQSPRILNIYLCWLSLLKSKRHTTSDVKVGKKAAFAVFVCTLTEVEMYIQCHIWS